MVDHRLFHLGVAGLLLYHPYRLGVEDHYRLDAEGRCHLDEADHYRLDAVGRCRLLDVVDHRDAGVRLDVKNCLDLGVRSWKVESAGDRGR